MDYRHLNKLSKCVLKDLGGGRKKEVCLERENPLHVDIVIWDNDRPVEYYVFQRLSDKLSYFVLCSVDSVFNLKCTEVRVFYGRVFEFEKDLKLESLDIKEEALKYLESDFHGKA